MALATQCPHCHTTFRVASDQLKLRGGIVRCGACQSIFDGNAHLIDLDALAAHKEAAAPQAPSADQQAVAYTLDIGHALDPLGILPEEVLDAPSPASEEAEEAAAELPEPEPEPVPAEDLPKPAFEAAPEPAGPEQAAEPEPAFEPAFTPEPESEPEFEPAPAPVALAYAPENRIEPSFDLPADEELVAQPLPGDEHAYHDETPAAGMDVAAHEIPSATLPLRASAAGTDTLAPPQLGAAAATRSARAKAVEARSRRSRLTPTRIDSPKLRVPAGSEADEPEFVKRSRKQEQSGRIKRLLTIAGAVLLALLLAAQLLLNFRNVLAARYPGARPVLQAGCALLGCHVGLPSQIENLSIETGELSILGADTYSLNTLLRNQGSLVQAWPSIQLELTDANDKPLLRRVFGPADYLPPGLPATAGFAAHSEQPVRLNFTLTGLKPSDYHMIVFYQDSP